MNSYRPDLAMRAAGGGAAGIVVWNGKWMVRSQAERPCAVPASHCNGGRNTVGDHWTEPRKPDPTEIGSAVYRYNRNSVHEISLYRLMDLQSEAVHSG